VLDGRLGSTSTERFGAGINDHARTRQIGAADHPYQRLLDM
jgi:hypothetical protein